MITAPHIMFLDDRFRFIQDAVGRRMGQDDPQTVFIADSRSRLRRDFADAGYLDDL